MKFFKQYILFCMIFCLMPLLEGMQKISMRDIGNFVKNNRIFIAPAVIVLALFSYGVFKKNKKNQKKEDMWSVVEEKNKDPKAHIDSESATKKDLVDTIRKDLFFLENEWLNQKIFVNNKVNAQVAFYFNLCCKMKVSAYEDLFEKKVLNELEVFYSDFKKHFKLFYEAYVCYLSERIKTRLNDDSLYDFGNKSITDEKDKLIKMFDGYNAKQKKIAWQELKAKEFKNELYDVFKDALSNFLENYKKNFPYYHNLYEFYENFLRFQENVEVAFGDNTAEIKKLKNESLLFYKKAKIAADLYKNHIANLIKSNNYTDVYSIDFNWNFSEKIKTIDNNTTIVPSEFEKEFSKKYYDIRFDPKLCIKCAKYNWINDMVQIRPHKKYACIQCLKSRECLYCKGTLGKEILTEKDNHSFLRTNYFIECDEIEEVHRSPENSIKNDTIHITYFEISRKGVLVFDEKGNRIGEFPF